MKFMIFLSIVWGSLAFAQVDLMQSSPSVQWKSIENSAVRVIYPDYLGAESKYIANLVEHYSRVVGLTYGVSSPEKFDLVIRPEVATPNGFVTLAPRRSEWFTSAMFFPSVGSTEWYQTLAIHEYRHVNQFDHFLSGGGTKIYYYLMGDFGEQIAAFMTLPSWYMEGDAVWSETKYTDGGRGRSPRFLGRLKALVLGQRIPTYDEFLSGTYKTSLPNQYMYGYALVSYGTQKYGEKVWARVTADAAGFPHPFRFYSAFERVTGQDFESFYAEAMNDLKNKWSADGSKNNQEVEYRDNYAPAKVGDSFYSIRQTLDSYPTILKEQNGKSRKLAEISYSKDFMQIRYGKKYAAFTEFVPDSRYGHKGFSELLLIDLNDGSQKTIVKDRRLYNPDFSPSDEKVMTIEFAADQSWKITEFSTEGRELQSFTLPEGKVAEARYITDSTAAVLLTDKIGMRTLVEVDLKERKVLRTYLPPSRNIISSIFVDKNQRLLFEAQYQGKNEVFMKNGEQYYQCSQSKIGAYTPSSDGENVYFSTTDHSGSVISTRTLASCQSFDAQNLVGFRYLGDGPSDNYNKFPLTSFPDQEQMFTQNADKYQPEDYGDFDRRLLVPHTWGLMLGRGGGLGFQTDNYLRTLGTSFLIGSDAEEGSSFSSFNFDIKKFYPIVSLKVESRNRKVTDYVTDDKLGWQENTVGAGVVIPYEKGMGLYGFNAVLQGAGEYSDAKDYEFNDASITGSNYFYKTSSSLLLSWSKNLKPRSIMAPWLASYRIRYDNAEQPSDSRVSSYRVFQEGVVQIPGAFANDGFKFSFAEQKQPENPGYRFLPVGTSFDNYVFSRGYTYKDAPLYQKLSGNYIFPISYENINLPGWYYLKRTYGALFFDSTYVTSAKLDSTLNSYGAEVSFESVFFRVVPMTFGGRVLQRELDNEFRSEFFLATSLF